MVYPQHMRDRAVRLFRDRVEGDDRSDRQRLDSISEKLGINRETLRKWVYQAEVDEGLREGVTAATSAEVAELRRKNAELEQTVEILKAATSFFARECDPLRPSCADSSPSTEKGTESHRSAER